MTGCRSKANNSTGSSADFSFGLEVELQLEETRPLSALLASTTVARLRPRFDGLIRCLERATSLASSEPSPPQTECVAGVVTHGETQTPRGRHSWHSFIVSASTRHQSQRQRYSSLMAAEEATTSALPFRYATPVHPSRWLDREDTPAHILSRARIYSGALPPTPIDEARFRLLRK